MHTFSETGAGVPAFLAKLWRLVEDSETNHLIYWNKDGRSFIIQNQAQFARELLPLNYKHNNMASFIRQLNMYGFHKITSIDNGGLKFDRDEMEFSHPCFKRGCAYLLEHIKRKIANTKSLDLSASANKTETVSKVLNEVKQMRGRQDSLDSRFSVIKQENEALWREIASLRQKHMKQQQIVNKLIQFLVTIVQPSRNMTGVKRNFQLMINDAPKSAKIRKRSGSESGPIIHELTEELLDEVAEADEDSDIIDEPSSPKNSRLESTSSVHSKERPASNISSSSHLYEHSDQTGEDAFLKTNDPNSSPLVYHISEIPEEVVPSDSPQPDSFINESILHTPLVQKEIVRNQKLRDKFMNAVRPSNVDINKKKSKSDSKTVNIKTENELDPMMFLETASSAGASNQSFDQELAAVTNSNNAAALSSFTSSLSGYNDSNNQLENITNDSFKAQKSAYNTSEFMEDDISSELFESNPGMADINITPNNNGNTSETINENIFNTTPVASSSNVQTFEDNNDLAIAKYNKNASMNNDTILKFNTPEDFYQHLDTVQDDLDNLKDLLKTDSYSVDANSLLNNGNTSNQLNLSTSMDNEFVLKNVNPAHCFSLPSPLDSDVLMKLFNDSDILSSYGLTNNENLQDNNKKGSEMIAYQPYLSEFPDLFDINSKQDDIYDKGIKSQSSSSVLNTPQPK